MKTDIKGFKGAQSKNCFLFLFSLLRQKHSGNEDLSLLINMSSPDLHTTTKVFSGIFVHFIQSGQSSSQVSSSGGELPVFALFTVNVARCRATFIPALVIVLSQMSCLELFLIFDCLL